MSLESMNMVFHGRQLNIFSVIRTKMLPLCNFAFLFLCGPHSELSPDSSQHFDLRAIKIMDAEYGC